VVNEEKNALEAIDTQRHTKAFEAQVAMCRAKNGELLTKKDQVLLRWKEHFEQHLNDGAGHDRPPDQVDLGDDGVSEP
jgi:hypothetical protein